MAAADTTTATTTSTTTCEDHDESWRSWWASVKCPIHVGTLNVANAFRDLEHPPYDLESRKIQLFRLFYADDRARTCDAFFVQELGRPKDPTAVSSYSTDSVVVEPLSLAGLEAAFRIAHNVTSKAPAMQRDTFVRRTILAPVATETFWLNQCTGRFDRTLRASLRGYPECVEWGVPVSVIKCVYVPLFVASDGAEERFVHLVNLHAPFQTEAVRMLWAEALGIFLREHFDLERDVVIAGGDTNAFSDGGGDRMLAAIEGTDGRVRRADKYFCDGTGKTFACFPHDPFSRIGKPKRVHRTKTPLSSSSAIAVAAAAAAAADAAVAAAAAAAASVDAASADAAAAASVDAASAEETAAGDEEVWDTEQGEDLDHVFLGGPAHFGDPAAVVLENVYVSGDRLCVPQSDHQAVVATIWLDFC